MISGNHFHPFPRVWLKRKIQFSGNCIPVDRNLLLWPGNEFTFSFSLQFTSGKRERERESARARARGEDPVRDRELQLQSDGAIDGKIAIPPSIAIWRYRDLRSRSLRDRDRDPDRDRAVDRDLAPSRSRIAIAPSIAIQIAIAIAPWSRSCDVIVDDFFSWLWLLFCVFWFVFSFFFSKHQKIFSRKFFEMQPNTWKHFLFSEISIFEKYVFSEKRFTATKHSLKWFGKDSIKEF